MERVDVACSTSESEELPDIADSNDEIWSMQACNTDVDHCVRCYNAMLSEYDVAGIEHGSGKSCIAVDTTDVACGSEMPAAAMVDVSCGPDNSGVVDVVDVGCGPEDVLQQDQFCRHGVYLYNITMPVL